MSVYGGPNVVNDRLVMSIDPANQKSFSPNVFPGALDIYSWYVSRRGNNTGNNCTVSQDETTSKSPAGGIPMLMSVTGSDSYIVSAGSSTWNICPALNGQTWTLSVWVKAAANSVSAQLYIFSANSSGTGLETFSKSIVTTTQWQRVELTVTFANANAAYVHMRLDGSNTSGNKIWWDGLQVELASAATRFNSNANTDRTTINDLVTSANNGTLINYPGYREDAGGSIVFNGSTNYVTLPLSTIPAGNEITFCLWNYGTTNSIGSVVYFPGSIARIFNIHLPYSDDVLYFDAGDGTTGIANYDRIAKSAVGQYEGWVYWCFTKNAVSGVMNIYRNGILWHTGTGKTKTIGTSSASGTIGQGPNGFHPSYVAHASFYSKELTESEIQQNFRASRGRFGV